MHGRPVVTYTLTSVGVLRKKSEPSLSATARLLRSQRELVDYSDLVEHAKNMGKYMIIFSRFWDHPAACHAPDGKPLPLFIRGTASGGKYTDHGNQLYNQAKHIWIDKAGVVYFDMVTFPWLWQPHRLDCQALTDWRHLARPDTHMVKLHEAIHYSSVHKDLFRRNPPDGYSKEQHVHDLLNQLATFGTEVHPKPLVHLFFHMAHFVPMQRVDGLDRHMLYYIFSNAALVAALPRDIDIYNQGANTHFTSPAAMHKLRVHFGTVARECFMNMLFALSHQADGAPPIILPLDIKKMILGHYLSSLGAIEDAATKKWVMPTSHPVRTDLKLRRLINHHDMTMVKFASAITKGASLENVRWVGISTKEIGDALGFALAYYGRDGPYDFALDNMWHNILTEDNIYNATPWALPPIHPKSYHEDLKLLNITVDHWLHVRARIVYQASAILAEKAKSYFAHSCRRKAKPYCSLCQDVIDHIRVGEKVTLIFTNKADETHVAGRLRKWFVAEESGLNDRSYTVTIPDNCLLLPHFGDRALLYCSLVQWDMLFFYTPPVPYPAYRAATLQRKKNPIKDRVVVLRTRRKRKRKSKSNPTRRRQTAKVVPMVVED